MSIQAGAEKRRGKRVVKERGIALEVQTIIVQNCMLQEAFDLFVHVKDSENVKPRTKKEYFVQYGYFIDWIKANKPKLNEVQNITGLMLGNTSIS
jgi:integrase/recombinase XerD